MILWKKEKHKTTVVWFTTHCIPRYLFHQLFHPTITRSIDRHIKGMYFFSPLKKLTYIVGINAN